MQSQVAQKLKGAVSPALKDSFSLVSTSFVNKCGSIGFTILPLLVVEKNLSITQGSIVLGTVKAAAIGGTLFGGFSSDRWGLRVTILLSFLLMAIGFGILPLASGAVFITLLAVVAQIGNSMFPSAARMMLSEIHGSKSLQEAIAWLRAANNAGQIISYSISAVFAALGTLFFYYIDAATSLAAVIIGFGTLTNPPRRKTLPSEPFSLKKFVKSLYGPYPKPRVFLLCTLIITLFSINYEMVIIGIAAKVRVLYHEHGLEYLSWFMIINTVFVTIFSVPASKWIHNIKFAFIFGTLISCIGGIVALSGNPTKEQIFLGSLLITTGEVIFTSMAQYALLLNTPEISKKGTIYSLSLIVQKSGAIFAGFLALPLVVYHDFAFIIFPAVLLVTGILMIQFFKLLNISETKSYLLEDLF